MQPKGGMIGSDYILIAALFQYPQLSTDKGASFSSLLDTGTWYGAAMSDNGASQLLCLSNGTVYESFDYGATWASAPTGTASWRDVFVSPNGQHKIATANGGNVLFRSLQSSWTVLTSFGVASWMSSACSDDMLYITAVVYGGGIRVSSTRGVTSSMMIPHGRNCNWTKTAMSSSGQYQIAVAEYDYTLMVYTPITISSNYGATWTGVSTESQSWKSACVSNTGDIMYAVSPTKIFKSSNYGATWSEVYENTNVSMVDIQCTSDGQVVYALGSLGEIIASADGGAAWQQIATTVPSAKNIAISNVL